MVQKFMGCTPYDKRLSYSSYVQTASLSAVKKQWVGEICRFPNLCKLLDFPFAKCLSTMLNQQIETVSENLRIAVVVRYAVQHWCDLRWTFWHCCTIKWFTNVGLSIVLFICARNFSQKICRFVGLIKIVVKTLSKTTIFEVYIIIWLKDLLGVKLLPGAIEKSRTHIKRWDRVRKNRCWQIINTEIELKQRNLKNCVVELCG